MYRFLLGSLEDQIPAHHMQENRMLLRFDLHTVAVTNSTDRARAHTLTQKTHALR